MYINYEYTQTDKIDAVETFHETSLQFQKDTIFGINFPSHFLELVQELSMIDGKVYYFIRLFSGKVYFCRLKFNGKVYVKKKDSNGNS